MMKSFRAFLLRESEASETPKEIHVLSPEHLFTLSGRYGCWFHPGKNRALGVQTENPNLNSHLRVARSYLDIDFFSTKDPYRAMFNEGWSRLAFSYFQNRKTLIVESNQTNVMENTLKYLRPVMFDRFTELMVNTDLHSDLYDLTDSKDSKKLKFKYGI